MSTTLNRDGSSKNRVLFTSILFMGLSHILYFKQYVKGIYTDLENLSQEEFVLWDASISFQATRWLSIYARGENLLAQCYEIMAGNPMPRATCMGGMHISF